MRRFEPAFFMSAFHAATTELLECVMCDVFSAIYPAQKLLDTSQIFGLLIWSYSTFIYYVIVLTSLITSLSIWVVSQQTTDVKIAGSNLGKQFHVTPRCLL